MVDYAWYRQSYAGRLIPTDTDWMAAEAEARCWLSQWMELPQALEPRVQRAICAAAEIFYARKQRAPGVQSESTDGYAVTYEQSSSLEAELIRAVGPYAGDQVKSVRWC